MILTMKASQMAGGQHIPDAHFHLQRNFVVHFDVLPAYLFRLHFYFLCFSVDFYSTLLSWIGKLGHTFLSDKLPGGQFYRTAADDLRTVER